MNGDPRSLTKIFVHEGHKGARRNYNFVFLSVLRGQSSFCALWKLESVVFVLDPLLGGIEIIGFGGVGVGFGGFGGGGDFKFFGGQCLYRSRRGLIGWTQWSARRARRQFRFQFLFERLELRKISISRPARGFRGGRAGFAKLGF